VARRRARGPAALQRHRAACRCLNGKRRRVLGRRSAAAFAALTAVAAAVDAISAAAVAIATASVAAAAPAVAIAPGEHDDSRRAREGCPAAASPGAHCEPEFARVERAYELP
jgi:hypothetical protein